MQAIDYPRDNKLKGLSADAETRRMAFVRERAMRDESSALRAATERGMRQGMQQGKREEAAAMLARLLTKRFGPLSEETSARLSAATLDQLDLWADRILDAPSVTAVFDGH